MKNQIESPAEPLPYTMNLPDGRTLFVEVPPRFVRCDRSGEIGFSAAGAAFLDKLAALASAMGDHPTPGHLQSLRSALGMTQQEMGQRVGVDKLTVSRWERGTLKPGKTSLLRLNELRRMAARRGIVIASAVPMPSHRALSA